MKRDDNLHPMGRFGARMKRDLIFFNNPVLMQGLALTPVVAAATSIRNVLVLSAALLLLIVPTRFICELALRFVGKIPRFRALVYTGVAAAVYIPAYYLLQSLFGASVASPGIYLPMLAADVVVISRSELASRENVLDSLRNGFMTWLGTSIVMLLFGAARELLTDGELYDNPLLQKGLLPIAGTVAGGLILASILSAAFQWSALAYRRDRFIYDDEEDGK